MMYHLQNWKNFIVVCSTDFDIPSHFYATDIMNMKMANNHILRMRSSAKCQKPVPQVVRVKDYYPDPSREYYPRCTILHRCGDDTGCCDHDAFRCVPSHVQEVTLYFYVSIFEIHIYTAFYCTDMYHCISSFLTDMHCVKDDAFIWKLCIQKLLYSL